ncbi:hypothetical protein [Microbacterium plantarum]|uniref:hypothetical protein n=1 Tax=Microbacterium plantarum TaxID=1816425 RepID=UPI002B4668FE|nr:hypothetical protein [Microbacterium plantarum]WRK16525.1 hypothetical protein VC184_11465 [Microbacterium plantarum]
MTADMAFARFIDDLQNDSDRRYRMRRRERWVDTPSVTFRKAYDEETEQKRRYLRQQVSDAA